MFFYDSKTQYGYLNSILSQKQHKWTGFYKGEGLFCRSGTEKRHEIWVFPVFRALSTYNFYKRNKVGTMHTAIGGNGSVAGVRRGS
jgi:hypothetical protein